MAGAMKNRSAAGGLIYSTDAGRMCPACRRPVAECGCGAGPTASTSAPPGDGIVRVSRETKGRGGKAVTVVRGLGLDGAALTAAARRLKTACGCGGTVKDGAIEVQGDHCDRVVEHFRQQGRIVKRAGG